MAPPEALWPFLADTSRLNRAIGLPPVHYTMRPADGGGSHIEAQIRLAGRVVASWNEQPFSWRQPYGYVIVREFHGGPFESLRCGVELTPAGGGTDLLVFAEFEPRSAFGSATLRAGLGRHSTESIVRQCRSFERHWKGRARSPFPSLVPRGPLPRRVGVLAARLATAIGDAESVERLRHHLETGRDDEVVKMRPFELADRWGRDRRATLALFLRATTAGLLTMSWDVLCPNCRVGKAEYSTLKDLRTEAHCDGCNIVFDASFDRLVEVRFSVAAAVRAVDDREYCVGGPMNTPHVVAQAAVPPGRTQQMACRLGLGSYRVRSPQAASPATLQAVEDGPERELSIVIGANGLEVDPNVVAPGERGLTILNGTVRAAVVAIEGNLWPDTIATAATVSTLQEFRDLFSSEVLAPGLQLGIRRLAFLFTDLTESTALYGRVGQARAFRIVQDHFGILRDAIAAHQGALVKTIGDAVMATFETGADALAAAVAIQRNIRALDVGGVADPAHLVRVGVHMGPCVAVTLNERLDYFGTTVNQAARVEHEARGGEIVATAEVCDMQEARTVLADAGVAVAGGHVRLRGLAEPVRIYRITVP